MGELDLTDFSAGGVPLTPILSDMWGMERSWTLDACRTRGGYQGLEEANSMEPADVLNTVRNLGLHGRSDVGSPTGLKWSFLPPSDDGPRYLAANADESKPGTHKNTPHLIANPYAPLGGMTICSRAVCCERTFIYLRDEVT